MKLPLLGFRRGAVPDGIIDGMLSAIEESDWHAANYRKLAGVDSRTLAGPLVK
jgi:hypothetical protein